MGSARGARRPSSRSRARLAQSTLRRRGQAGDKEGSWATSPWGPRVPPPPHFGALPSGFGFDHRRASRLKRSRNGSLRLPLLTYLRTHRVTYLGSASRASPREWRSRQEEEEWDGAGHTCLQQCQYVSYEWLRCRSRRKHQSARPGFCACYQTSGYSMCLL